jgi:hypothetical protein
MNFLQVLNIQGKDRFGKRMTKKRCFCQLLPNIKASPPPQEPVAISFVQTDKIFACAPIYTPHFQEIVANLSLPVIIRPKQALWDVHLRWCHVEPFIYLVLCDFLTYIVTFSATGSRHL